MRHERKTRELLVALALVGATLWLGGLAAAPAHADPVAKLDLNRATLEQMLALPIPPDVARAIHDYRTYDRYFSSVYDLLEVPGVTPGILAVLKPLVETLPPPPPDEAIQRLTQSYRQARRYLGQEGSSEGLADEYFDMLLDPVNVNDLDLFDLMSFQNVSPVDATSILGARDQLGGFENAYQLRRAEGMRYWAYRNLRDFVVYSPEDLGVDKVRGQYTLRYYDTPYASGDDESLANLSLIWGPSFDTHFATGDTRVMDPAMTQKMRLNLTHGVRVGATTHRNVGESTWDETAKLYLGVSNKDLGPFHLKRGVLGNFRVAFGQGLVMDNTDFIHFRQTGYGWNKRPLGVRGDLSRTREYALNGAAFEGTVGPVNIALFGSTDRKDVILNDDGTVNRYVAMVPRPSTAYLDQHLTTAGDPTGLARDALQEDMFGGAVHVTVAPGTFVGVSGYSARYNRAFDPDPHTLYDYSITTIEDLITARDSEVFAGYRSVFDDQAAGVRREYKFRRVFGTDFQTVYRNVAVQGEYAWLQDPRRGLFSGDNPKAWLVNAYTQWENLNLLAIYRDYDLDFDNPYQRSFSNDSKYEQTLLDSPFRLQDDLYSWLVTESPQPKAEKGLFLSMNYRISRTLNLTGLEYDQWQRKADGADLQRYTIKAEYQPIFNLRLRLRQRYSSRTEAWPTDVRTYRNWETRWQLIALLSNYNRLQFTYMTSNVQFPPRPRLTYPAPPGTGWSGVGLAAGPAHAFEARYEHNLTPGITLQFATSIYDGFLWNFEGNEFVLLDGSGFRNWFKVESRVSQRLLCQLKVTRDHNLPKTYLDRRSYGNTTDELASTYVPRDELSVRLQLDYSF